MIFSYGNGIYSSRTVMKIDKNSKGADQKVDSPAGKPALE